MITKQELENLNFPKIKGIIPIFKNIRCKFYPTYLKVSDNVYLWCPKLNSESDERGNNKWFNVISNDEKIVLSIHCIDNNKLYEYLYSKNIIDEKQLANFKSKRFEKVKKEFYAETPYYNNFYLADAEIDNKECSQDKVLETINKIFYEENLIEKTKDLLNDLKKEIA